MAATTLPMIVDTDTHVCEPPDLWTSRMSAKEWGDLIPHVEWTEDAQGPVQEWVSGARRLGQTGVSVVYRGPSGERQIREDIYPQLPRVWSDVHPSAYDPRERVKVMDETGIRVAALYPNVGLMSMKGLRDNTPADFSLELIRAYNDYILSWCEACPGRFIPLALVPYWDVVAAVAEIGRCSALGHLGIITTGAPQAHGLPSMSHRQWDPMWAAAEAAAMPVSFHIATGDNDKQYRSPENRERMALEGHRLALARMSVTALLDNSFVLTDLLVSGILPRFPHLKFISVESGMGWIPFTLEALDYHFDKYRVAEHRPEFEAPPSFYFRRQVYVNYWFEKLEPWHIEKVGTDNLLWETDYPHPTSFTSADEVNEAIRRGLSDVTDEIRDKILWKNAACLYGLALP
jgi:predicted TIM-barrel fold metal-dependent hydrolase